jgi:hypothetical protein
MYFKIKGAKFRAKNGDRQAHETVKRTPKRDSYVCIIIKSTLSLSKAISLEWCHDSRNVGN